MAIPRLAAMIGQTTSAMRNSIASRMPTRFFTVKGCCMNLTDYEESKNAFEVVRTRASAVDQETASVQEHFLQGLSALVPATPLQDSWPKINQAAYHGIAGVLVRVFRSHTESGPRRPARLVSRGSGRDSQSWAASHPRRDFSSSSLASLRFRRSSKSRKGTAGKRIEELLRLADASWTRGECKGTLSSGEGLAFAVRDPQYKEEPIKEKYRPTGETISVLVDPGIEDKRLFLVQSEFGAVLRVMARDGNSLSGVLRDAWDGQDLAPMTKSNRIRATAPHIGLVGHVTRDELLQNLNNTEASNGFGNRFVWLLVQRSQELPFPSSPDPNDLEALAREVGQIIRHGRALSRLTLTEDACEAWKAIYHDLSADRPGLAGSLLGRAEAQTMRLAGLYALLDRSGTISSQHLMAALALWEYAETSTRQIFGDSTGDLIADTILRGLRSSTELDDTAISALFGRNISAARLDQAKATLVSHGLVHPEMRPSDSVGRHARMWRLGTKQTN